MKTTADKTQRTNHHHRSGDRYGAGWEKKAARQRNQQQRAYHKQENKEMVRRVIARVSAL